MDSTGATIWLDAPLTDLLERMESKDIIMEAGGEAGNILQEMLLDRNSYYEKANIRVPTDDLSPEMTVSEIMKVLNEL